MLLDHKDEPVDRNFDRSRALRLSRQVNISTSFLRSSYGIVLPSPKTSCSLSNVYWSTFNNLLIRFSFATCPGILGFHNLLALCIPGSCSQTLVLPHS